MNNSDVEDALKKAVEYYGLKVQQHLSGGKYPTGQDPHRDEYVPIEKTKKLYSPKVSGSEVSMLITFGDPVSAPYAVAYEFGSGEHRQINPKTYKIEPKEEFTIIKYPGSIGGRGKRSMAVKEKVLAIGSGPKKRNRGGWFPSSERNVALSDKSVKKSYRRGIPMVSKPSPNVYEFYYVDHPGIKPKSFAITTWIQEQDHIVSTFGLDLIAELLDELATI